MSTVKPLYPKLNAAVAQLSRAITTPAGLDAGLMTFQYTSPIVAAILLKLVQLHNKHPVLFASINKARFIDLAGAVVRAGGDVGAARTIMRAFGLIPMIDWLLKLHPNPLRALANFFLKPSIKNLDPRQPKVLDTIRVALLCNYYIQEHRSWLGAKGVLKMTPEQLAWAGRWGIRSWAVDICISAFRLVLQHKSLKARQRALEAQSPEGFEVAEKEGEVSAKAQLAAEFETWKQTAMTTFGWVPLTLHWSTPGGLWTNPLITAAIGSWICYGKWYGALKRAA